MFKKSAERPRPELKFRANDKRHLYVSYSPDEIIPKEEYPLGWHDVNGALLYVRFGNIRVAKDEQQFINDSKVLKNRVRFAACVPPLIRAYAKKIIRIYGICPNAILYSVEPVFNDEED